MIYFIRNSGNNLIKIGFSTDPEQRIKDLQTANPNPLEIILIIEGDLTFETRLHRRFDNARVRNGNGEYVGEWFYPIKGLIDFIRLEKKSSNEIIKPQRRIYQLDRSMIRQPKLFSLNLEQIISNPPKEKIDKFNQLFGRFVFDFVNNNKNNKYDYERQEENLVKEICRLSKSHKKWIDLASSLTQHVPRVMMIHEIMKQVDIEYIAREMVDRLSTKYIIEHIINTPNDLEIARQMFSGEKVILKEKDGTSYVYNLRDALLVTHKE